MSDVMTLSIIDTWNVWNYTSWTFSNFSFTVGTFAHRRASCENTHWKKQRLTQSHQPQVDSVLVKGSVSAGDSKTLPFASLTQPSVVVNLAFEADENTTFVVNVGDFLQVTGECSRRERHTEWDDLFDDSPKRGPFLEIADLRSGMEPKVQSECRALWDGPSSPCDLKIHVDSMAGHVSTQVLASSKILLSDRREHHDGVAAINLLKLHCTEGSLRHVSWSFSVSGVPHTGKSSPGPSALLPVHPNFMQGRCDEDVPKVIDMFTPTLVQRDYASGLIEKFRQEWLGNIQPSGGLKVVDVVLVGSAAVGTALKKNSDLDVCVIFNSGTHAERLSALSALAASFVKSHPDFMVGEAEKVVTARLDTRGVFRLPREAFAAALGGTEAYQIVTIQDKYNCSIDLLPCIPVNCVPREYQPQMNLSANPAKVAFFQSLPEAACQAIVLLKLWSCGASANELCRVYENAAERRWPLTDCKLKIAGYPLSVLAAAVWAGNRDAGLDPSPSRILVDVLAILASSVSKPLLVLRNGTATSADGPATATEVFHQLGVRRKTELEPCIFVQDAFYDCLFFKVGPMPLDKIRRQAASTFFRISTTCDLGRSFRWSNILASGSSEHEDAAMMPQRYSQISGRMNQFAGLTTKSVCPRRHSLTQIHLARPSRCHECETVVFGEEGVMYGCPSCPGPFQVRLCSRCKESDSELLLEPSMADLLRSHAGILDFAASMLAELA